MTGRAIGSHQSANAGTTTWLTPLNIIDDLGPFDLDPCGVENWPTAATRYCLPTDGLAQQWLGRVWLNPPYSFAAWRWLARLAEHGSGTALVFARTETAGFVSHVWERATALRFLHGRIRFHHEDGSLGKWTGGAPSVLVAYGKYDAYRLRSSSLPGSFVSLERAA